MAHKIPSKKLLSGLVMGIMLGFTLLICGTSTYAQPQYAINFMTAVTPSDIPFNSQTNNKAQWLFYSSDFSTAPSGNITTIYFRRNFSMLPVISSFTNLTIKMGSTNLTVLPPGPWITTGMNTVFQANTYDFLQTPGDWMPVTLQTPFNYNGTSNFIVEVSHGGYSVGFQVLQAGITARSLYGGSGSLMGNSQNFLCEFGFDIGTGGTDVSFEGFSNLSDTICSGFLPVAVVLRNNGPAVLTSTTINWKINNLNQPPYHWTGNLTANSSVIVTLGSYNFIPAFAYDMVIWSTNPNNQADINPANDTLLLSIMHIHQTPQATPAASSYSICSGDSVYISGTLTGSPPWSVEITGGTIIYVIPNIPTPNYGIYFSPASNTTYTVLSVTDASGCTGTGFPSSTVTVNPNPVVNLGPDQTIKMSDSITLIAGAAAGSYVWSTGQSGHSVVIHGSQYGQGTHPFSVIFTNTFGCIATDTVWITIVDDTGIEEYERLAFTLFPNPTAGNTEIIFNRPSESVIKIEGWHFDGRMVFEQQVPPGTERINLDLSHLSGGLYLLKVTGYFGTVTRRLIIEH